MSGFWGAITNDREYQSAEELKEAALKTGPLGTALLHTADRLPNRPASYELTDCSIMLDFDDQQAPFRIAPKSREFARAVRALGPEAAGDKLAEDFFELNEARAAVLKAVKQAAAARGWHMRVGSRGFLFAGVPARWFFGETRREVTVVVGEELTELLRTRSREETLRELLAAYPDFLGECLTALHNPAATVEIAEVDLPPDPPTNVPALRELDDEVVTKLDHFAQGEIEKYFHEEKSLLDYDNPEFYDAAGDTWASMSDWVALAERHISGEWPRTAAMRILLDADDPRGEELARNYLRKAEPHHEVDEAEIAIAWRFRHEMPEMARNWFSPQAGDQMPYAKERAALGDPVAERFVASGEFSQRENPSPNPTTDEAFTRRALAGDAREQTRARLLEWARTSWRWSPARDDGIKEATPLGLTEVAETLEENPFLTHTLLCGDRRDEQSDEPGLLFGGQSLLLNWSKLKPTKFMARIIATAFETDLVAEARRVSRESVERKPELASNLSMTFSAYDAWNKQLQTAMAIAWTRFRKTNSLIN
jgi:hypothetical protein